MSVKSVYEQNYVDQSVIKVYCGPNVSSVTASSAVYARVSGKIVTTSTNLEGATLCFWTPNALNRWSVSVDANGLEATYNACVCSYPGNVRKYRVDNRVGIYLDNTQQYNDFFSEVAPTISTIDNSYDYTFVDSRSQSQYTSTLFVTDIGDIRGWEDWAVANGPFNQEDFVRKAWKDAGQIKYFLDRDGLLRGSNGSSFGNTVANRCRQSVVLAAAEVGLTAVEVFTEAESDVSFHQILDFGAWNAVTDGALGLHDLSQDGSHFVVYWEKSIPSGYNKKAVIYHETGHVFGLEHPANTLIGTSVTIMSFNQEPGFNTYTTQDYSQMNSYFAAL